LPSKPREKTKETTSEQSARSSGYEKEEMILARERELAYERRREEEQESIFSQGAKRVRQEQQEAK